MANIIETEFDIEMDVNEELPYMTYEKLSYLAQEVDDIIETFKISHPSIRYLIIDDLDISGLTPDTAYELSCNGYEIFCEYLVNELRELLFTRITIDLQTSEASLGHPGKLVAFEYNA